MRLVIRGHSDRYNSDYVMWSEVARGIDGHVVDARYHRDVGTPIDFNASTRIIGMHPRWRLRFVGGNGQDSTIEGGTIVDEDFLPRFSRCISYRGSSRSRSITLNIGVFMDTNDNITVIYMDIHIRGEFAYEDENSSFFDSDVIFPKTSQIELFYLFHMRSAAMSAFGASGTGMKATHMPDSYWLSVLPMACQLIMFFPVIIVNYMVNQ